MVSDLFHTWFISAVLISISCVQIISCNNTTTEATTSETSNNATWLVIGVGAAFFLIIIAVIIAGIVYVIHKKKRIHPHSDTESFYSEGTSERDDQSRPTTASHIFIEPGEEAMSKPVTMTPFELRKLYVETFPYSKWRRGYDGALRPQMPLQFVDPSLYKRTKQDESKFRESILTYEMPDTLTVRSAAPSRLATRSSMRPRSNLEPISERAILVTKASGEFGAGGETHHTEAVVHFSGIDEARDGDDDRPEQQVDDVQSRIMSGDDTEL